MKTLGIVAGALLLILCAVFVWPTQWRYEEVQGRMIRINRINGKTERLTTHGWIRMGAAAPIVSPHASAEDVAECMEREREEINSDPTVRADVLTPELLRIVCGG